MLFGCGGGVDAVWLRRGDVPSSPRLRWLVGSGDLYYGGKRGCYLEFFWLGQFCFFFGIGVSGWCCFFDVG